MKTLFATISAGLTLACVASAQNLGMFNGLPTASGSGLSGNSATGSTSGSPVHVNQNVGSLPSAFESVTLDKNIDKVFDVNSDSFDTDSGNINWKGRNFNIGHAKIIRARFEKYLAMTVDLKDYNSYQAILSEVSSMLSASNDRLSDQSLRHAWSRMFDAAEYPYDSDACMQIANSVYTSWRMKDEYFHARNKALNDVIALKRVKWEKKTHEVYAERAVADSGGKVTSASSSTSNSKGRNSKDGARANQAVGANSHMAELAYQMQRMEEATAQLVKSSATAEIVASKAILQYQSQIMAFVLGRKFQSAQLACMFYRHIYRGKVQLLEVGKDDIAKMFPVSQFTPNIDMLEGVANDARKDVRDGMNAVNSLYDSGERFAALERLQETFALGENDPYMYSFDPAKRRVLYRIYRDLITIKKLSEIKDWIAIEEIVADLKLVASDFPSRQILSNIRTAKRASNMHLMAAKQAMASGDTAAAKASMDEAGRIWPLNPALDALGKDAVGLAMGTTIYVKTFDELLARKDYRAISEKAPEFAMCLSKDKERLAQLRDVIGKIGQLDMFIAQAKELEKQRNTYPAWEILENAMRVDPNDPLLARARAALAPEVADYVKMLDRAKRAEAKGDFACALNYFLAAQQIFPASQTCREGIERVAPRYTK